MAKKTNPAVIGGFVLGALALVVAAVLVFGGGKFFTPTEKYVLYFEGSVKGLNVGSPVVFRGVKIGEVTDIALQCVVKDLSFRIPVTVEIRSGSFQIIGDLGELRRHRLGEELLEQGLRAQLQLQSLVTGQLMVEFDLHPGAPLNLVGVEKGVRELPTIPTKLQQLTKTIEQIPLDEIGQKIARAAEGLDDFLGSEEARGGIQDLRDTLAAARILATELADAVDPLTSGIQTTLQDSQTLLRNLDAKVDLLASSADQALQGTRKLVTNVDGEVDKIGAGVDATLKDTRKLVQNVDSRVDPVASGLEGTLQDTRQLVGNVDGAVLRVAGDLDEILAEAKATLARAKSTLTGLQSAMADDSVLQYEVTKSLNEVSGAARSVRVLAEFLQQRPDALLRGKGQLGGQ